MVYVNGGVRCTHEGCGAEAPARLVITPQGLGLEPVPGWVTPEPEIAYCPEHVGDYVPPPRLTRAEARQRLIEQGAPPDIADEIVRTMDLEE